jgi:hypothetical protein
LATKQPSGVFDPNALTSLLSGGTPAATGAGVPPMVVAGPSGQRIQIQPNQGTQAPGGSTQDPNSTSLTDQPYSTWLDPYTSPATWAMSNANAQMTVYSGDPSVTSVSPLKLPVLLGQMAARLGIKHKQGVSTPEQVLSALGQQYGIDLDTTKGGTARQGSYEKLLGAVVDHVTGKSLIPGHQTQPISLTDPQAWTQIAQGLHISTQDSSSTAVPQFSKWQDVAQGMLNSLGDSSTISKVQAALLAGQFYDEPAMQDPTKIKEGNLDTYTVNALGHLLQLTSEANAQGQRVNWFQFLTQNAASQPSYANGQQLGDYETAAGITTATAKPKIVDTPGQLAPSLRAAYEADLGFAPSTSQLEQFTSEYQQAQLAKQGVNSNPNGYVFLDQNNVPEVPGVASPSQAAGTYAITNDQNAYLAHQVTNAAALFQNALVKGKTILEDPNVTSAARPL